jgi:hypothetical protein
MSNFIIFFDIHKLLFHMQEHLLFEAELHFGVMPHKSPFIKLLQLQLINVHLVKHISL